MAATIEDVARLANCSITTVSRAFSAPDKVRERTKARIFGAATSLNYAPNAIARAMVLQKNHSLAFVIHEKHYPVMLNPFYADIAEAMQTEAEKRGYNVYVTSTKIAASDLCMRKRVDGVILAGQMDQKLLHLLRMQNMPIVLVNNQLAEDDSILSITADDYGGAVRALEHLIARGHRKIGLISGNLSPYIAAIRYQAYFDTMAKYGLPVDPGHVRTVEPQRAAALHCVDALLRQSDPPTALFCMNDQIAVGAIKAALRQGKRVPEDLAVVGYDDSSVCTVIEPELTSVSVDTQAMGRLCATKLIGMIGGEYVSPTHLQLETGLVVRQST